MNFSAPDPEFQERALTSFDSQGFLRHIGAKIVELRPGHCEVQVAFRDQLTQQHGYFSGGVVAALADVASGYAAFSLLEADASNVTVEFKLNFLAPASGEHLIARGSVIKSGKILTVCQSNVFSVSGGSEKLCATAISTLIALPGKAEKGA